MLIMKVPKKIFLFLACASCWGSLTFANDINGKWDASTFVFDDVIPLHSTLTPDGKVFGFGATPGGSQQANKYVQWTPQLGTGATAFESVIKPGDVSNLFCTAQIIIPETGKLMAMGGQIGVDKHRTFQFDLTAPDLNIEQTAPMALNADASRAVPANQTGRYYATSLVMPDGKILILGGSIQGPGGPSGVATPELYTPATNSWKTLTATTAVGEVMMADKKNGVEKQRWWYPRAWVAPNGRVFGLAADKLFWLDVAGNGLMEDAGDFNGANWGATSTAVMYAPGKILQVGGGTYANTNPDVPAGSKLATLIDVTGSAPVVTQTAPMNFGRHWANSVVLPDGKVLVTGGAEGNNTTVNVAKKPELWDPATGKWTLLDTEELLTRQYHSVSLLLPDGRVMSGGGGAPGPGGLNSPNAQLFNPPYLYNGTVLAPRPTWGTVPPTLFYGQSFAATVGAGQSIGRVTLIKNGSTTHSFNFEQRFIELAFTQQGNSLTISAPANANLATPGFYMLFALDAAGTPSVAKIVKLEAGSTLANPVITKPANQTTTVGSLVSLALVASDPDGGAVTFAATGLPTGLAINPATGVISGTPTLAQSQTVTVTVTDNEGAKATTSFTWTIQAAAPVGSAKSQWLFNTNFADSTGTNNAVAAGGIALATDPVRGSVLTCDGVDDVLTIANTVAADFSVAFWLKTTAISPTATQAFAGQGILWSDVSGKANDFVLSALNNSLGFWDGASAMSTNMTTAINNGQWHHIAVTRKAGGLVSIYLNGSLAKTGTAGTPVLTANPVIKICGNPVDGKFFNGLLDDLKLFDGVLSASAIAALAVPPTGPINTAPVLTNPGNKTTTQNTPVSLSVQASDADNNALSFSATGLPTGLAIGAANGVITGSPTVAGTFAVTVTVTDSQGASDSEAFTWVVTVATGGNSLGIISPGLVKNTVGQPASLQLQAGNVANLTFTVEGLPPGLTFNAQTGLVSGTPTATGAYAVTVIAQTAFNNRDIEAFTWHIVGAPVAAATAAGGHSTTLVVSGTTVWAVNPDHNSVTAVNTTNNSITQVPVGKAPWSLALSPLANELWVVNKGASSISVVSLASQTVIQTIALPAFSQPHGIVFGSDGFAYVALEATSKLLKINAQTDAVVGTLSLVGRLRHLGISGDGQTVYVSRFVSAPVPGETGDAPNLAQANAEIYKVATNPLRLVSVLTVPYNNTALGEVSGPGLANYLSAPVMSPNGASLWVPSKQDNIGGGALRGTPLAFDQAVRATTSVMNLATGARQAIIDHDNSSVATGAVFSGNGQYLFVALETSREVAIIATATQTEIGRIPVGRAPQGLALNAAQTALYVHNFMDRSLSIVNVSQLLAGASFTPGAIATVSTVTTEALSPTVFKGKQFFYDAFDDRLAQDNYMSCAACHNEGDDDGRVWDFTQFGEGVRNTIRLRGKGGMAHGPLHWTGNFDEIQDFEGQIRAFAGGIGLINGQVQGPLAAPNANLSSDLDALSAYLSSLTATDPSPLRNANGTLTSKAALGKAVFASFNCGSCHSGANFTDSALNVMHDIGTLTDASGNRLSASLAGLDTPSLLGVWASGPYLHDGSATTLKAAIVAHEGIAMGLTKLGQLDAYLKQLDDNE